MRVRVRMFGALAERAGRGERDLDLPDGARASDALRAVGRDHPSTASILGRISVAVNLEVVPPDHPLRPGDEVALLPPVAGGSARIVTGLRDHPTIEEAVEAVTDPSAGGTVVFTGTVRDEGGSVARLEYSAYEEMAERVLGEVAGETAAKWPVAGLSILHGVGALEVGETTVVVACSAPHRGEAFEACRYAIEEVKRRVPVWKKESGPGGERWVGVE